MTFDVVVPTAGRPTLDALLERLETLAGAPPQRLIVVEDGDVRRGPAAARNRGWRQSTADWVVFLDDDVVPQRDWLERLAADLDLPAHVAGSQGRIHVPLPKGRRPTDWERNVRSLETARYATADMAYRRSVLAEVGGFDERFPRAYREDADLALRVLDAGYELALGTRTVEHPVRPAGFSASVRLQAGNADDALMRVRHGRRWRERAGAPKGRRRVHLVLSAAGGLAVAARFAGRPRLAHAAAAGWLLGTAEFAVRRIAPGPRSLDEVVRMIVTSAVVPAAATAFWLAGWARVLRGGASAQPAAVLFDRDGTLIEDIPYNGDPSRVVPVPGAREALDRVRAAGVPVGVISNQSGVARGLITTEQVDAVNRRVEELLGPVDGWFVCPHGPDDGCECRKPAPGLVLHAATSLGVDPARCAVVGDIGADIGAARAAGARAVLVPRAETRPEEVEAAPEVADTLGDAIELLLGGRR